MRRLWLPRRKHLGLRVNDEELREELQHGQYAATFFPEGKFIGQEAYEDMIQHADMTVPQFEARVKDDILRRKLYALVSSSAFVSDAEVRDDFEHRNVKVKFEYAVIAQADILKELHPTDDELKAYYGRNKATYNNTIPESGRSGMSCLTARKRREYHGQRPGVASILRSARRRVPRPRASEGRSYFDQDSAASSGRPGR